MVSQLGIRSESSCSASSCGISLLLVPHSGICAPPLMPVCSSLRPPSSLPLGMSRGELPRYGVLTIGNRGLFRRQLFNGVCSLDWPASTRGEPEDGRRVSW
jgi:hypothetical protein